MDRRGAMKEKKITVVRVGVLLLAALFLDFYYAGITLIVSYVLSSFAVGVVIRAMVEGGFTTFRFTLLPLLICTPLLLIFAVLIPCCCFRNLEKQSIVERLRME